MPEYDAWVASRLPALLRFGYLLTGSRDAAEEAVQAALTRAWEQWPSVADTRDPDAYVRRMVVNAHVSGWRRFGRRQSPVAEPRPPAAADPTGRVAEHDAVWRVCRTLPERQRAAVVLRFYEDLDHDEIAEVLGCSPSTVRSQIHRALAALRVELARQEADDG